MDISSSALFESLIPLLLDGDNRTTVDQLIKNNDDTYIIVETKLSDKTPLSKGQKRAREQVENGNQKFEVRNK